MADMMKDLKDFAQEYYLSILKEITHPPRVAVGAGDLGPSLFRVGPDAEASRGLLLGPFLAAGCAVAALDTTGCGASGGSHVTLGFFERYDVACVAAEIRNRYGVGGPGEAPLILYGRGAGAVAALLFADRADHDAACAAETPRVLSLECKAPEKDHALAGARFQPTTMFFNVSKPALKTFLGPDDEPPIPASRRETARGRIRRREDELEYVFDAGGPGRPEREHAYAATPPPCVLRKKPPRKSISRRVASKARKMLGRKKEWAPDDWRLPRDAPAAPRAPPRPPPVPPAWVFHYEFARRALDEDEEEFGEDPRRPAESGEDPRRR
ncbi:S15 peptidase-like protein [Aureococcus anophagefferens]|nr:S15 peptidase-like protein [Aureococcus anophagefferens]